MRAKHYEAIMDYMAMMVLAFIIGFFAGKGGQIDACQATFSQQPAQTKGATHDSH